MNLADIGRLVHGHRQALGFSRASINQLETGSLMDLGAAKLIALLDLVGQHRDAGTRKGQEHALQSVSQSASVSYRTLLDPAALVEGALPKGITPHIATLLNEVPLSLIVAAVEEVENKRNDAQDPVEACFPLGQRPALHTRRVGVMASEFVVTKGCFGLVEHRK